eukprot:TRINITY_DN3364_c0_g1_i4.p1 TRINITY_DN3364_c0_g1~~TRINITY_DN3364_c0_g1_i4.p1  ORF type:complete len:545 (+),score=110.15 TRINITY_DN3364_c0_g1_i4:209-1636(+)
MASTKKLKVNVISGRNLTSKNGSSKNDPYCELVVLDDQGNKIGKTLTTKVIKSTLDPTWNQLLEFSVGSNFSGLKLRCWDKHKFKADKFLGQVTIKFNTALLSSSEKLDEWVPLQRRKTKEEVSGDVHLQIQYGDLPEITKARSGTVVAENSGTEMKVSGNFNTEETNNKLKSSTLVVVMEEEEDDENGGDKLEQDYEKVREGPSAACLEKIGKDDKDILLTNKNLEVTNNSANYYSLEFVKGNVKVLSGKWYFETRIINAGQIAIGWCTAKYDPKKNQGDCWWYEGSRQQKQRGSQPPSKYGEYWSNGDIIGCSLNIEAKTVQYWKNGKDMGVAHTDASASSSDRFCALIGVSKRTKCQVNFGKETFAYPVDSCNMLHSNLSDKEIEQLARIFVKYRDLGNRSLIEDGELPEGKTEGDRAHEVELKESIHGAGLVEFQKDLGVVEDDSRRLRSPLKSSRPELKPAWPRSRRTRP